MLYLPHIYVSCTRWPRRSVWGPCWGWGWPLRPIWVAARCCFLAEHSACGSSPSPAPDPSMPAYSVTQSCVGTHNYTDLYSLSSMNIIWLYMYMVLFSWIWLKQCIEEAKIYGLNLLEYCIQRKFGPHFIFALFAIWPEGEFKTGPIELYTKDHARKFEKGRISLRYRTKIRLGEFKVVDSIWNEIW